MKVIPLKKKLVLRWYQEIPLNDFFSCMENLLLQAPTGAGKTIVGVGFCFRAIQMNKRTLIVVKRIIIVKEFYQTLTSFGIDAGYLQGDEKHGLDKQVVIASIDTLCRYDLSKLGDFDFLFIDEGHDAASPQYHKIVDYFKELVRIFSQTATPYRRESLRHIADRIVKPAAYNDLVREGYLVKPRTYAPIEFDLSKVRVTGGEYNVNDLYRIYSRDAVLEDLVRNYLLYANGLRSLLFAPSKAVALSMKEILIEAGIPAAYADDSTPIEERQELIQKLVNREILVLCNVQIFAVGVNIPQLEAVIVTRPTLSLALHIQMLGRGSRPHPDKKDFVILDMAGNCERHSLLQHAEEGWLDERVIDADTSSKSNPKTMTCPECSYVFMRKAKPNFCQNCGWVEEVEPRQKPRTKPEIHADIQDLHEVSEHKRTLLKIIEFATVAESKSHKPGSVYHQSRILHGHEEATLYCPEEVKEKVFDIYSRHSRTLEIPDEAYENFTEFQTYLQKFYPQPLARP